MFFDSQKQALKKHISEIHEEGKKPFKCDICDQSSSQKGNLSIGKVHESKKPFTCNLLKRPKLFTKGKLIEKLI